MKFFKENPPKAVFWYGFGFVCVLIVAGMGYFAYIVANEKPEVVNTKKDDIVSRVYANSTVARANAAADGKVTALSEDSFTVKVDNKDTVYKITDETVYVTGPSQESGSKEDLKVGMIVSFTYNLNTMTAVNVNY